jgi:16S rRNA A1518/A1519 N6-dimethyltransferase RsmA/KsgA/DIM1 with predicted DNA glycosylase/AP lyase activity
MAIHEDLDGHEIAALTSAGASFVGRRVREIGCGDGRLTRRYAHEAASIVAIDPDPDAIARLATAFPTIDARAIPVDWLELPARSVDAVLFSWSF